MEIEITPKWIEKFKHEVREFGAARSINALGNRFLSIQSP